MKQTVLKSRSQKEERMRRNRGKVNIKRYLFLFTAFQLSSITSILFYLLTDINVLYILLITNLVSGLIFFWIDRLLFQHKHLRMRMWDYK